MLNVFLHAPVPFLLSETSSSVFNDILFNIYYWFIKTELTANSTIIHA